MRWKGDKTRRRCDDSASAAATFSREVIIFTQVLMCGCALLWVMTLRRLQVRWNTFICTIYSAECEGKHSIAVDGALRNSALTFIEFSPRVVEQSEHQLMKIIQNVGSFNPFNSRFVFLFWPIQSKVPIRNRCSLFRPSPSAPSHLRWKKVRSSNKVGKTKIPFILFMIRKALVKNGCKTTDSTRPTRSYASDSAENIFAARPSSSRRNGATENGRLTFSMQFLYSQTCGPRCGHIRRGRHVNWCCQNG